MQAEGRTLHEITRELEVKVDEIIQSRPTPEPQKKGLLSWMQKVSYTDTALQAVKALCTQIPAIAKSYSESSSKVTFAITQAFTLIPAKSNLDALDPKTWTPKVEDEATKQLALAVANFARELQIHNETALSFLEQRKPDQLEYELVKSLPPKPAPGTIYVKSSSKGMIEYCYASESNAKDIKKGSFSEERLGEHKTLLSSKEKFDAKITESKQASKNSNESLTLCTKIYNDSGYHSHTLVANANQILDNMRSNIKQSIAEYDKTQSTVSRSMGNK